MQVTDPVCGMTIDSETAAGREIWRGQTYYFCCKLCQQKFHASPDWYVKESDAERGARGSRHGSGSRSL